MKARFMTKTALSALALAFAGALPGVAQQTASPAAVPAVNKVKASAVEKAFMNQMAGVVQASLKAGALDMKAARSSATPTKRRIRTFPTAVPVTIPMKRGASA